MEERLKEGFTLTISGEYDNISGGYLKYGSDGIIPASLIGNEVNNLESFPSVLETIKSRKILQLYLSGNDIVGLMGSRKYEPPYAEIEYLEVSNISHSDSVIGVLQDLDSQLSKKEEKEHAKIYGKTIKAYKLYGSGKYELEEKNG